MLAASNTKASPAIPPATSLSRRGANRQATVTSALLPTVGLTSQNAKRVSEATSHRAGRNSTSVHSSAASVLLLVAVVTTSRCSGSWGCSCWATESRATIARRRRDSGLPSCATVWRCHWVESRSPDGDARLTREAIRRPQRRWPCTSRSNVSTVERRLDTSSSRRRVSSW